MTTSPDAVQEQLRLLTLAVLTLATAQRVDGRVTPAGARAAEYASRVVEVGGWPDPLDEVRQNRERDEVRRRNSE